jgi:hypothetical protein
LRTSPSTSIVSFEVLSISVSDTETFSTFGVGVAAGRLLTFSLSVEVGVTLRDLAKLKVKLRRKIARQTATVNFFIWRTSIFDYKMPHEMKKDAKAN